MSRQSRFAKKAERNGWPVRREDYQINLQEPRVGVLVPSLVGPTANVDNYRAQIVIRETGEPVKVITGLTARGTWKTAKRWLEVRTVA